MLAGLREGQGEGHPISPAVRGSVCGLPLVLPRGPLHVSYEQDLW